MSYHFIVKPVIVLSLLGAVSLVHAQVSSSEAERLGRDLTPVGAERAGSADGVIPAWDGGLTDWPEGYRPGMHHPDPFAEDDRLFVITTENMDEHADYLTDGHKAMLRAYPETYKIPVYPTRRSASYPEEVYEATRSNAVNARLVGDGDGVAGTRFGFPFPIPSRGEEVIWNHLMRYRGEGATRTITQASPNRRGDFTLVEFHDEFLFNYGGGEAMEGVSENILLFLKQTVVAPARLAGSILLVHETLDQVREPRRAWTYNVGQRRVRRAPNVAYDNPGTASDGMRTSDQFDMFNGALDRYNWEILGKREVIVPYNNYRLHSDSIRVRDILRPLHINQDLTRYERHRVWVVEATLREGTRHIYARRVFYVDEDSWQILAVEQYDGRGQLWRVSEGFAINFYEVPCLWTTLEVHTDLQAGRYLAIGMDNELRPYDFSRPPVPSDFTPANLRREGVR
ncbi:MAG: DUF1329 domain-containing protein [Opitutales bacterium]|nr:DUF1329 domain-containing protein [Opitutales bacterium]